MKTNCSRYLGVAAVVLGFFLPAESLRGVQAAGIVVNTDQDVAAVDGLCSLREAINNANSDSDTTGGDCAAGSGTDTITFAGDYTITLNGSQLPPVTAPLYINGNGAGQTIIQAHADPDTATWRVFEVPVGGFLHLSAATIRHGRCQGACGSVYGSDGGGFLVQGILYLTDCAVESNISSNYGGGINNRLGTLLLTRTEFLNNSSAIGGGICNWGSLSIYDSAFIENSAGGSGGAIYSTNSLISVSGSTFSHNTATDTAGGILIFGGVNSHLFNCTFSANESGLKGGGIQVETAGVKLSNCTFSDNAADFGGGLYINTGNVTLNNNILANSISENDCENRYGTVTNNSSNLIETDSPLYSCGWSIMDGQDPLLGPLADNGGFTMTHALLDGSPAINMASSAGTPGTDQRGVARPQGVYADIGAYELAYTLTVTVNQSADQSEPVTVMPVRFTALFADPIDAATFDPYDILLGGTAPGMKTATIAELSPFNGTTFEISVSGMLDSGTVTASIQAARVIDLEGNTNYASTSENNVVAYEDTTPPSPPTITLPTDGSTIEDDTPTISGTAEIASTVSVNINDVLSGAVKANWAGNWSYTPADPVRVGLNTVTAMATDGAGNESELSVAISFTLKGIPLYLPLILQSQK